MTIIDPNTQAMADWKNSLYFKEALDHPGAVMVHPGLVWSLDSLRNLLGAPVMVSPNPGALVATSGHSDDPPSWHYILPGRNTRGMAADIMVNIDDLLSVFFAALRMDVFGGVGLYPFWKPKPGLHVDLRPSGVKAVWWQDEDGEYHYPKKYRQWQQMFEDLI